MFTVIKSSKEKPVSIEVDDYIKKHQIPTSTEYAVRNKIKDRRESLGLTQANVAEMLNITRQSLSLIEKEKQTPTILMCWLISQVLEADITELFYFEVMEEDENGKKQ
ncbi:helix-turn-helix domain-containing protein [Desulfosporosinus sp.]|uniref:helix-turn-helix transcriptional regulator n=1 Tax=Desulfosporosinus sp. TaxID=157907 RepID=UPI0025B8D8B3|nr:helix-turn-helix domain-containing protein [Desulfosporosinus sp.]MBC2724361.1 helix-turn-helix domain-containing protein [Desulfosporosinus sp.]MBC2726957.1 helix-turn-helix domain-containing protein [Desulfosporosinus sp.]